MFNGTGEVLGHGAAIQQQQPFDQQKIQIESTHKANPMDKVNLFKSRTLLNDQSMIFFLFDYICCLIKTFISSRTTWCFAAIKENA